MLPPDDLDYLKARAPQHVVSSEGGMICVVLPAFPIPEGLSPATSDLLFRLSPGYPDVPPDMWWFNPPIRRTNGGAIPATQVQERHLGRDWQRWSRHLSPGQWRSGVDSIESYLSLVHKELDSAAKAIA